MSEQRTEKRRRLAKLEADPAAAYERHKEFAAAFNLSDRFGSVDAYMSDQRRRAQRPDLRVTRVQITRAGRARLTVSQVKS